LKIFGPLYDRCRELAAHPHAEGYLFFISMIESIFFPVPPDVMVAPMALAKPKRWFRIGAVCTVASVFGAMIGYALGHFAIDAVLPWIERVGYMHHYDRVHAWFAEYGIWIIFVAAFTPIPYKVFTVGAGAAGMSILPFILISLVGRGARFLLVAGLVAWGGPKIEPVIKRYIEMIGWVIAAAIIGLLIYWQMK
jgi:membrane protein YqaA with SNARE-associated domain